MDKRIAICAAVSVGGHVVLAETLELLPELAAPKVAHKIAVRVVEPPPPPPIPEPEPEPEPVQQPAPVVHEAPRPKPSRVARTAEKPVETPVTSPSVQTETSTTPVYGFSMSSSSSSTGPAVPAGNTTRPAPTDGATSAAKPLAAPAAAIEVTKMPMPLGRCSGKYTEAAKQAGIEGVVVLDLVVDERGRAREVVVKEALSHGLTEAAVAALQACTFTPGERNGQPVAVRVRSFKIRFLLQDA
jgi:protein TonB